MTASPPLKTGGLGIRPASGGRYAASPEARPTQLVLPWQDPALAFRCFADDPYLAFFDSCGATAGHSYLCLSPGHLLADPFASIAFAEPTPGPFPFSGGAAGFIGYDSGAALDRAPRAPGRLAGIPDAQLGFYDTVLAFDHANRTAWLTAPSAARAEAILDRLVAPPVLPEPPRLSWRALVSRDTHIGRLVRVLQYIAAGDIYQANLAVGFEAPRPAGLDPAALYLTLRAATTAPFSAYIGCGAGCAVLSASPERFLRLGAAGTIETRPIKGTRPRAADPAQDAALAADLLASEKDRAENLMIVDLLRNDLARVANAVAVPRLCALESFTHVHHLVSTVTGQLRRGLGPIDLLRAAFPGGSITGAPKLRAMEIIAELERRARGPYCGSALWIGNDGAMDSNILIRTITVAADRVVAAAGGGIVADSDPAAEWEELLVKILPLLRATGTVAL
jgi:para-aminobenzoate synthetase component 1